MTRADGLRRTIEDAIGRPISVGDQDDLMGFAVYATDPDPDYWFEIDRGYTVIEALENALAAVLRNPIDPVLNPKTPD